MEENSNSVCLFLLVKFGYSKEFMEVLELKELLLNQLTKEQKYLLNTKQSGETWELLTNLDDKSVKLVLWN